MYSSIQLSLHIKRYSLFIWGDIFMPHSFLTRGYFEKPNHQTSNKFILYLMIHKIFHMFINSSFRNHKVVSTAKSGHIFLPLGTFSSSSSNFPVLGNILVWTHFSIPRNVSSNLIYHFIKNYFYIIGDGVGFIIIWTLKRCTR